MYSAESSSQTMKKVSWDSQLEGMESSLWTSTSQPSGVSLSPTVRAAPPAAGDAESWEYKPDYGKGGKGKGVYELECEAFSWASSGFNSAPTNLTRNADEVTLANPMKITLGDFIHRMWLQIQFKAKRTSQRSPFKF